MSESFSIRNLIKNARLVLPQGVVFGSLQIAGGRISAITSNESSADAIDLDGLTVFPGFIDLHIHGAIGVDTMRASAPELEKVAHFLSSRGVTSWMPTLVPGPVEQYAHAIAAIREAMGATTGAEILGVHYEGPFVNSDQCGALHSEFFRTFGADQDIADLPRLHDGKHLMTVAPEVDGGIELIRKLVGRGWLVSIGHTRADAARLDQAFTAGAKHMTHFMNAMASLHHRSPGPIAWGLLHDDVSCDVIADGIHLDPAMLKLLLKLKRPERLVLISDAIAAAGLGDGDYEIWGETISVRNNRTSNARGSIAGSVITVLDAVKLMKSLGANEVEIAAMSSTNAARVLGVDSERGSIEVGKRADLVALDDDGNVKLTMTNGQIVYP